MALLVDLLFATGALSGLVLCLLGVYCYRQWDEPGVNSFAAVAVCLGAGGVVSVAIAVHQGMTLPDDGVPVWADAALTVWVFTMIPWIVFTLQYTGRVTRLRGRTLAAISGPILGSLLLIGLQQLGVIGSTVLTQMFGTLTLVYVLALLVVGSYLLIRTTHEYGHLSVGQGLLLALAGAAPILIINLSESLTASGSPAVAHGAFVLAFVVPTVALLLSVFSYTMFASTPAAGALGDKAIARETDDFVFVVDPDERIITVNQTATRELGLSPTPPLGEPLTSVLPHDIAALRRTETVELETTVGARQFDPQVTPFTDQHDRQLGTLLSFRDVTDRRLRKQRLEVLNRVLRHNLRNEVDVIKSNAEAVSGESNTDFTASIVSSADELAALSAKARSTDQLMSKSARESTGDLSTVIRELIDHDEPTDVTLDIPESTTIETDWQALEAALESAIENAIEYADSSVTVSVDRSPESCSIAVSDDGPGIPDSELAVISEGTETQLQHGTGLGLWQLKWAVTRLNGDLEVDTAEGTTVRMTIPVSSM